MNLTPVALMEAMAFTKTVFGGVPTKPDYQFVASAVFCNPPLASVGGRPQPACCRVGLVTGVAWLLQGAEGGGFLVRWQQAALRPSAPPCAASLRPEPPAGRQRSRPHTPTTPTTTTCCSCCCV
jgi:hypothetical protein